MSYAKTNTFDGITHARTHTTPADPVLADSKNIGRGLTKKAGRGVGSDRSLASPATHGQSFLGTGSLRDACPAFDLLGPVPPTSSHSITHLAGRPIFLKGIER